MKMNEENMKRFESMIMDFADEHGLKVDITHEWDFRRTSIRMREFETRASRDMIVDWDTKKSLSQAGAIIFSYITREFDLDGSNVFLEPKIKNVIFNDPATIVLWEDGSKTVVKCQDGDVYSKETGLAVAIAKKALGNKGNFNEVFKKWIPEYDEPDPVATAEVTVDGTELSNGIIDMVIEEIAKKLNKPGKLRGLL